MRVAFEHPRLLLLAPIGIVLCALVLRRTLVEATFPRRLLHLALRSAFLCALVVALAGPIAERPLEGRSVVALVDRSASVDPASARRIEGHLSALRSARGRDDRLAIIAFGGQARRAELADDASAAAPLDLPTDIDPEASDLEGALRLAEAALSPGRVPSLLLYSDGNETTGRALALTAELARRGIPVDVVPVREDEQPEILVRSVGLPKGIRAGARFEVTAEIFTRTAQRAIVSLYRDEFLNPTEGRRELDLPAGRTVLRWKSEVPSGGLVTYSVRLSGPLADHIAANNRADTVTVVRGDPRVLLIEGGGGGRPLVDALGHEHIAIDVRSPSALPSERAQLEPYDLVMLSDVAAGEVGPSQAAALEAYIEGGGGFLFLGGENATEGWTGSRIEKLLPVRFERERRKEEAQLALVLAIDRSGSMEAEGRLELAKAAAKATAELLGPEDLIGVVAFDTVAQPIVRLQRAANRLRISTDISRLRPGGGTAILPALREAYAALEPAHAKVKHVILLTDGQAIYDGIPEQVREMVEHKITVSAVGVGGEADRSLLTTIAQRGNGRFYFTKDAEAVPKIFLTEANEMAKRSLVEDPTKVRIVKAAELFAGTGVEAAPALGGYVGVRMKPGGELLLVSSKGDPLLARRRDGLGQAAIWTSDAKNRWANEWLRWPGYARFFAQLVRSTMRPALSGEGTYPTTLELDPPFARVSVDALSADDRFVTGLDGLVERVAASALRGGPSLARQALVEVAPGRYQAELRVDGTGPQLVRTILRRDGVEVSRALSAISPPPSREHSAAPPDLPLLEALRGGTGGRLDPAPGAVFTDPLQGSAKLRASRPLWDRALWAALLLLVLDLAARRWPTARTSRLRKEPVH